jgi:conjugative relaxase-like TrwC/TraI family protein
MLVDDGASRPRRPLSDLADQLDVVVLCDCVLHGRHRSSSLGLWVGRDETWRGRAVGESPDRAYIDDAVTLIPNSADRYVDYAVESAYGVVASGADRALKDAGPDFGVEVLDVLDGDSKDQREASRLGGSVLLPWVERVGRQLLAHAGCLSGAWQYLSNLRRPIHPPNRKRRIGHLNPRPAQVGPSTSTSDPPADLRSRADALEPFAEGAGHHLHRGCRPGRSAALLSIGKLGMSPDQLAYYELQVAQGLEDYLSGRGEAPGRWIGGGCGGIGLAGELDRDVFMHAMAGCDPRTGAPLRPPNARTKIAAFDLTFSAPKSVSVLFAVADEETSAALLEAHERAVEEAFAYMEREACFTRRGHGGVQRVRGEGFVAGAYRHRLSRAGDPQLHTHAVVANMTRAEGRWTTLEAHGLYEHALAAGALYRAVLRAEVRERLSWVLWREVGRGLFEIEGLPHSVLREFSRRRVEIEERAFELTGVAASKLSRERLQGIALATRNAKEYGVDGARWRDEARARAAEHGLGERELVRLSNSPAWAAGRSEAEVVRWAAARLSGPDGLTAKHNTFARRHVLAEIAGDFSQGADIAQLERTTSSYLKDRSVVPLGRVNQEHRFTTRDLLACEAAIVQGAVRCANGRTAVLHPRVPGLVLADTPAPLSGEQLAAVRRLIDNGQGVSVLEALAGTGKTRVLAALARVYESAGYHVVGVAPTGRAARELGDAAGLPAFTIHRLISELEEAGGFTSRTVVLLDEAGSAPTRPSAQLLAAAERAGAKVIGAGDSGQLPSVAAGGWFAAIANRLGGPELLQVMRQRDPSERDALEALHDGDPQPYIALKHEQRALAVYEREVEAFAALLRDWDQARREHGVGEAVMIARDNATRELLNDCARQLLARDGTLEADGVIIADQEFRVGDRVIARRNDRHRYRALAVLVLIGLTQTDRRCHRVAIAVAGPSGNCFSDDRPDRTVSPRSETGAGRSHANFRTRDRLRKVAS